MKAVQPRHASARCQPSIHQASRPRTYPIYNNNRPIRHLTPTLASCRASSTQLFCRAPHPRSSVHTGGNSGCALLLHRSAWWVHCIGLQRRTRLHVRASRVTFTTLFHDKHCRLGRAREVYGARRGGGRRSRSRSQHQACIPGRV
jgi:hypothetical protein